MGEDVSLWVWYNTVMLILYYKPTCPFCQRVLEEVDSMNLDLDLRDITAEESHAEALIAHGGKRQVPYLIDEERNEAMYESSDIIAYLAAHYGEATEAA